MKDLLAERIEEETVSLTVRVKKTTVDAIDEYAKAKRRNRYEVIDALVERYLPFPGFKATRKPKNSNGSEA